MRYSGNFWKNRGILINAPSKLGVLLRLLHSTSFIKCLHFNELICSKKLQFLHQLQMLELLYSVGYKLELHHFQCCVAMGISCQFYMPLLCGDELLSKWAGLLICHILQVVQQSVRPCLVELSEDPDVDVRYFAGLALETCDQYMLTWFRESFLLDNQNIAPLPLLSSWRSKWPLLPFMLSFYWVKFLYFLPHSSVSLNDILASFSLSTQTNGGQRDFFYQRELGYIPCYL